MREDDYGLFFAWTAPDPSIGDSVTLILPTWISVKARCVALNQPCRHHNKRRTTVYCRIILAAAIPGQATSISVTALVLQYRIQLCFTRCHVCQVSKREFVAWYWPDHCWKISPDSNHGWLPAYPTRHQTQLNETTSKTQQCSSTLYDQACAVSRRINSIYWGFKTSITKRTSQRRHQAQREGLRARRRRGDKYQCRREVPRAKRPGSQRKQRSSGIYKWCQEQECRAFNGPECAK